MNYVKDPNTYVAIHLRKRNHNFSLHNCQAVCESFIRSKYRFTQIPIHPNTDSPKYRLTLQLPHVPPPLSTPTPFVPYPLSDAFLLFQLFNTTPVYRLFCNQSIVFLLSNTQKFQRHSLTCFIRKPMFIPVGVYIRSRFKLTRSNLNRCVHTA